MNRSKISINFKYKKNNQHEREPQSNYTENSVHK